MAEEKFSLPPLITDKIQGKLVMIILRPALVPALNSNQSLEFRYCWWGSSFLHKVRLAPDLDELRVVYDIRSDIKGLQRYLTDAESLKVEIVVPSEKSSPKCSLVKCQIRRKKEWRAGDFVGKFTLSNLRLNARGEYVNECNIINDYGDHLGSVIVFILFTSETKDFSHIKNSAHACEQPTLSEVEERKMIDRIQSSKIIPSKDKNTVRENLSPRFVVFDNSANTRNCKSPLKRCLKSPSKPKDTKTSPHLDCEEWQSRNSDVVEPKIMSQLCGNENFILTKLFSFVDAGAIHPSDLPTLIQICQGRSPSIDLDTCELHDKTMISLNNVTEEVFRSGDNNYQNDMIKPTNKNVNDKKVNFSGASYCSSPHAKQTKSTRVFDEEFLHSLALNDQYQRFLNATSPQVKSFPELKCNVDEEAEKMDNDKEILLKNINEAESSLLVLRFHSVHFNYNFSEPEKDANVRRNQCKKIVIRQKSKLCYFVEVDLEFEKKEGCQNALYISRQIKDNQEIIFNTTQIFRFPTPENETNEGYLKFKVSRRRLGQRLRESVGVGIISLDKLRSESEGEKRVILPLWAASDSSEILKFSNNGKTEMPLGRFCFSTFALTNTTNHRDNQSTLLPDFGIGNPYRIQWGGDDENLAHADTNECKDILNETFTTEGGIPFDREPQNTQESFIIERNSDVKYIPVKNSVDFSPNQEVHLEILEGNGLPLLRSKSARQTIAPNAYVLTSISSYVLKTGIVKCSSTPVWNYRTNFTLHREDLEHTNFSIILKVFHSLDGVTTQPNDPFLGFAPIDTAFLWTSFLSLCGWIPVLNLDGELCGELKVSLTPKRSKSLSHTPGNSIASRIEPNQASQPHIDRALPRNSAENNNGKICDEEIIFPRLEAERLTNSDCRKKLFCVSNDNGACTDSSSLIHHSFTQDHTSTRSIETIEENSIGRGDVSYNKGVNILEATSIEFLDVKCENKTITTRVRADCTRESNSKHVPRRCNIESNTMSNTMSNPQETKSKNLSPVQNSKRIGHPATNPVIEAMRWMNQGTLDSPCVSYLDLGSKEVEEFKVRKVTKRKSRIAANLNFLRGENE